MDYCTLNENIHALRCTVFTVVKNLPKCACERQQSWWWKKNSPDRRSSIVHWDKSRRQASKSHTRSVVDKAMIDCTAHSVQTLRGDDFTSPLVPYTVTCRRWRISCNVRVPITHKSTSFLLRSWFVRIPHLHLYILPEKTHTTKIPKLSITHTSSNLRTSESKKVTLSTISPFASRIWCPSLSFDTHCPTVQVARMPPSWATTWCPRQSLSP